MNQRGAALAAAGVGIFTGAAIVASRFALAEMGPGTLALVRYAIAVLCLVPVLALRRSPGFALRDLVPVSLIGIVQFALLIVLLNIALQSAPAARVALLFATMPLLTLLIGAALGREALTGTKTAGVLVTILGVALALGEKVLDPGAGDWLGELAALAGSACGAACSVLYRPYVQKYDAVRVSALAMLASVICLVPLAAVEGFFSGPPAWSPIAWAAVWFVGIGSGVFFFLWVWALNHTSPTRVTVFVSLTPVTAALLGAALLGEAPTLGTMLGLACVVAGLWLAHRSPT